MGVDVGVGVSVGVGVDVGLGVAGSFSLGVGVVAPASFPDRTPEQPANTTILRKNTIFIIFFIVII